MLELHFCLCLIQLHPPLWSRFQDTVLSSLGWSSLHVDNIVTKVCNIFCKRQQALSKTYLLTLQGYGDKMQPMGEKWSWSDFSFHNFKPLRSDILIVKNAQYRTWNEKKKKRTERKEKKDFFPSYPFCSPQLRTLFVSPSRYFLWLWKHTHVYRRLCQNSCWYLN